jgi:biotin operon repressor
MGRVKRRIVAALRRNRSVSGEWLFGVIYRKRWAKRSAIKAHIWQLRRMGYPIHGGSRTPAIYTWGKEE